MEKCLQGLSFLSLLLLFRSVQFKMVTTCSGGLICDPPRLWEAFPSDVSRTVPVLVLLMMALSRHLKDHHRTLPLLLMCEHHVPSLETFGWKFKNKLISQTIAQFTGIRDVALASSVSDVAVRKKAMNKTVASMKATLSSLPTDKESAIVEMSACIWLADTTQCFQWSKRK